MYLKRWKYFHKAGNEKNLSESNWKPDIYAEYVEMELKTWQKTPEFLSHRFKKKHMLVNKKISVYLTNRVLVWKPLLNVAGGVICPVALWPYLRRFNIKYLVICRFPYPVETTNVETASNFYFSSDNVNGLSKIFHRVSLMVESGCQALY